MNAAQLKSTLGFYAQRLFPGALGIFLLPWLFAVVGPLTYQLYSIQLLLAGAISMLFGSWIAQSTIRNLTKAGYDRHSLSLLFRLLAVSAVGAALVCAGLLRTGLAHAGESHATLCIAAALMTAQTALLPVVQAVGEHLSCLVSEIIRTCGTIVLLGVLHNSVGMSPEMALALGTAAALVALLPAAKRVMAAGTSGFPPLLPHGAAMLRYGAPLSAYNGLSLWLQYAARSALVMFAGSTASGGSLVIIADLCQKIVGSFSSPLVASQVPTMIVDFNAGLMGKVNARSRLLERMILACAAVMLLAVGGCFAFRLWLLGTSQAVICAFVAVLGNTLLQLTVCVQKQMEFRGATARLAVAMGLAALTSIACIRLAPPSIQVLLPGLNLLAGTVVLYLVVLGMVGFDARTLARRIAT